MELMLLEMKCIYSTPSKRMPRSKMLLTECNKTGGGQGRGLLWPGSSQVEKQSPGHFI